MDRTEYEPLWWRTVDLGSKYIFLSYNNNSDVMYITRTSINSVI